MVLKLGLINKDDTLVIKRVLILLIFFIISLSTPIHTRNIQEEKNTEEINSYIEKKESLVNERETLTLDRKKRTLVLVVGGGVLLIIGIFSRKRLNKNE